MRDAAEVRTTLDLDEDVLLAAKEIAAARKTTTGKVASELMRTALTPGPSAARSRNGVPLFPKRRGRPSPLTMAVVNRLRDD